MQPRVSEVFLFFSSFFLFFFLNLFLSSSAIRLNQRSFVVGRRARKAGRDERGGIYEEISSFLIESFGFRIVQRKRKDKYRLLKTNDDYGKVSSLPCWFYPVEKLGSFSLLSLSLSHLSHSFSLLLSHLIIRRSLHALLFVPSPLLCVRVFYFAFI